MKQFQQLFAFNSSRYRLSQENAAFAAQLPKGALVLDAGAGHAPYKHLFQHTRYESLDIRPNQNPEAPITYVCDLQHIPVEDQRYDFIVFNQVMEHLPEPQRALHELYRVLKDGGKMLYTGPLFFEEHGIPHDFYRYTQFGLRHMFTKAGFTIERIAWLEGYFGTVGYQLHSMAYYLPWKPGDLRHAQLAISLFPVMFLLKAIFAVASVFFHVLETYSKYVEKGYPKNYVALVRKG